MFGDESDLGCDCHYSDDHPNLMCADGEGLVRYERCNTDIHCRKYLEKLAHAGTEISCFE